MIDVLAFGAHPDDVEISVAGTLLSLKAQGYKTAVVDFTEGDLSTNGTVELRRKETEDASKVLQLDKRINLKLPDGRFEENEENRLKLMNVIRELKPTVIIAPDLTERHPDHERCARMVKEANFYAGLKMYMTEFEAHRAKKVYYATYNYDIDPNIIFDISEYWEQKLESIKCYRSQFIDNDKSHRGQASTFISRPEFLTFLEAKARYFGEKAGVAYGEPLYTLEKAIYTTFPELTI